MHKNSFPCTFAVTLLVVGLQLFSAPLANAQGVDPSLYAGLRWRCIGPFRGGRALAAAGVPGEPETFYFGAVGGGVWKTNQYGSGVEADF